LIDNYDCLPTTSRKIFCELGADVLVKLNDETGPADIRQFVAGTHLHLARLGPSLATRESGVERHS